MTKLSRPSPSPTTTTAPTMNVVIEGGAKREGRAGAEAINLNDNRSGDVVGPNDNKNGDTPMADALDLRDYDVGPARDAPDWQDFEHRTTMASKDHIPISEDDVMIGIMGVTGSGKSTFISLLTNGSAVVGHTLEACTSEVRIYSYLHRGKTTVHLIDTPGFDDTYRSDTDVLKEIAFSLAAMHSSRLKLAGMLYLHRITDRRIQGSALKNLQMFKALCGEASLPNVVLVTTMWNMLGQSADSYDSGVRRENELKTNDHFWGLMEKRGSRIVRHDGDAESALSIVSLLVDKKKRCPPLDIQRQMVDEGKPLDETAAGQVVQKELLEALKGRQREIADYQQSMEDALKEKDLETAATLQKLKEEDEAKVTGIITSEHGLKVNFEALASEKEKQYSAARQLSVQTQTLSAAEIAAHEESVRRLQDELDRKNVEYRRDIARMKMEQEAKSAEESVRIEKLIMAKEKEWVWDQLELKARTQFQQEIAIRKSRESGLTEARRPESSNHLYGFLKNFISSWGLASSSRGEGENHHDRGPVARSRSGKGKGTAEVARNG